ncbi:MAG: rhodanese-like domain-containing protein [Burkholderiales bacterium]|nr:MAG: rhodanese-like domain-containing protein [Burkholderiales bacterium]
MSQTSPQHAPSSAPQASSREADAAAPTDALLALAAERGRAKNLPYHGALTPAEAWALHATGAARLVDVRTEPEWTYVGRVEGSLRVEWRAHGEQQPNPRFIETLGERVPRDVPVMMLCRSGVRSHAAAELATRSGWTVAMNVLEGFEGDLDEAGQRGSRGGWRKAGLPWVQS